MICPNDGTEMKQVKAESHYGQTVVLDQCPGCGGIWFDHFELYKAKQGEADKIELLNADGLRTSTSIENQELICPKDRVKLVRFKDVLFPKDIVIARCPVCNGFWLNRGEFTRYQQYRQTLVMPRELTPEDEKLTREMERILAEHKTGDTMDALGQVGKFLSTPVDPATLQPLEPEKLSEKEKNAYNTIIGALLGVLRLFAHI
jgi:Zn-finger nucleic acid-binding protein